MIWSVQGLIEDYRHHPKTWVDSFGDEETLTPEEQEAFPQLADFLQGFAEKGIGKHDILAYRDVVLGQIAEKRLPGGPYAEIPEHRLWRTVEGVIRRELEAFIHHMNVQVFVR